MIQLLWWVFAAMVVAGGLGMVFSRTPIASLMFLVTSFFGLAAIYVILGAHFIAAIQVIVYAGAIMVLFLFVIMLLNLGLDYRRDIRGTAWVVLASVAAAALVGMLGYFAWRSLGGGVLAGVPPAGLAIDEAVREHGAVGAIGLPLFRHYLVHFEVTGILLLVALVGAVLLAKRRV
jgi:NADH-quinone oxidoreductase subunit J